AGQGGVDQGGLLVAVLDGCQAERNRRLRADDAAHRADDRVEGAVEQHAVVPGGAGPLAQADHHHLHPAALDGAVVAGVRLDAGDDADVVGGRGVLVEVNGPPFGGAADLDDLHRAADRRADEGFGDAVAFEDLLLALGGGAAVAAHGGDEKRSRAEVAEELDGAFEDDGDVGDAAAARGQGDRLAGPDAPAEV